MNFIERITGIFTKPEETIKDILAKPRIEEPIVIVAVYAVVALLSSYLSSSHMIGAGSSGISVISIGLSILFPFIAWFIATAVVYGLTMAFFNGEGKFYPEMLTAIGYTTSVKVLFAIVALLLLMLTPTVTIPAMSTTSPTGDEMRSYADALESLMFNPFYILSFLAGMVGLVWSCYLGMLAVKNGLKVKMSRAVIVVGVPMALYILILAAITFGSVMLIRIAANAL